MNLTKPFQVGVVIVAITTLLSYTNLLPSAITNIAIVLTFGFVYLVFCAKRNGLSIVALFPIIGALAIIFLNQDPTMISLVLIWMLYDMIKNSELDKVKIAKTYAITASIGYVLILIAYFTVHLNSHADMVMWRIDHLVNRASLGFQQPNAGMLYALSIAIAVTIAYKINWTLYISGIIIAYGLFHFNQSRTGFVLIVLLLTLAKFNLKIPFVKTIMLTIAGISYSLMVLPVNPKLDTLLSGRLALYQSYKADFGIHPLGNPLVDNAMIDNGYVQMILSKGFIFVIFFVISILLIVNTKNKIAAIVFLVFILSAFTETTFLHLDLLIPVLIITIQEHSKNLTDPNHERTTI